MARLSRRHLLQAAGGTATFMFAGPAAAQQGFYYGDLILRPLEDGRLMQLIHEFGYQDSSGTRWTVPKDTKVDGASIPPAAWPFIGGPWEGRYRAASVIHDYFCDKRTRTMAATHKVFHQAMLTSRVEKWRADVMYTAVKIGGPKWSDTVVHNNQLSQIVNVFNLTRPDLDATAQLATQTALSATALQVQAAGQSADQFALVNAALPQANEAVWNTAIGSTSSATVAGSGSALTARILGRRGDGIVVGFEDDLPLSEADFEVIKISIPQEGLSIEALDGKASEMELEIRARRIFETQQLLIRD